MAAVPRSGDYTKVGMEEDFDDDGESGGGSRQQIEMAKQDEDLDTLHDSIKRLGNMSLHISNELDSQNIMLDELNTETDAATAALQVVTKQTKEMIKQSGGIKTFCVIIALTLLLIFLTYLVLMT